MARRLGRAWLCFLLACGVARSAMAEPAQPVTIGVLTDMSGSASDSTGPGSVAAAQMAVEDFGGSVLGRPIKVIAGDHQLKADIGAALARQWYDEDGVSLIVDVPVSPVGLAVQAVAKQKHRLFITTATLASDFVGKFCTPYTMQWVFNTASLARGTIGAMLDRGVRRWFFLTADFAFGMALERDAATVIRGANATIVGSVRHPFSAPDMTSFVVQALSSDAQAIALANGPPDNTTAIQQASEFGLAKSGKSIVGLYMLLTDVHALGLPTAQGLVLTSGFYWDLDERTRAWSERFFSRMGKMPTAMQAGNYSAVTHWLRSVRAAGTLDADAVAAKMRQLPIEDMFARHAHLRADGALVHDLYLMQVKTPAESKGPWDLYKVLATIPGDQAFPPPANCPLAMQ